MKKRSFTPMFSCLAGMSSLLLPLSLMAADKHVHGEADLFVVINQQQVLIELETPAANIIGFEHSPKTEEQKQILRDAITTLGQYSNIVRLNKNIVCTVNATDISNPFEEHVAAKDSHDKEHGHDDHKEDRHDKHKEHGHDKHKEDGHDDHKEHGHDKHKEDGHDDNKKSHTDFHVSYDLTCPQAQAITSISITGFERFTRIEEINVNWIKNDKQAAKKTTPSNNRIDF